MRIEISREDVLLDTGGGLKKAAWFFQESAGDAEQPFLLHNVDVLSTINLRSACWIFIAGGRRWLRWPCRIVKLRATCYSMKTIDYADAQTGREGPLEMVRPAKRAQPLAFSGIHVISPQFLSMMSEDGVFSIIDAYLRLAARGERIVAFRADEYYWRDLGKPESLKQAEHDVEQNLISL